MIKKYRTTESEYGYNLSNGGSNGSGKLRSKKVYQYDIDGNLIGVWRDAQIAGDKLNIIPSNISACCLGVSDTCNNFVWSYKKLNIEYFKNVKLSHCTQIKQYDKYGNYIKTFHSIKEASEETGIKYTNISTSCQKNGRNTTKGLYRWTYADEDIDKNMIKSQSVQREINQYDLKQLVRNPISFS